MKNSVETSKISFSVKLSVFISTLIIGSAFVAYKMMSDNGNESNAAHFISSINEKQKRYFSEHHGIYAPNFRELDKTFQSENVLLEGYAFSMEFVPSNGTEPAFYSITGDPKNYLWFFKTGNRHFYFDSTLGTMRSTEENRQAKADDPTI